MMTRRRTTTALAGVLSGSDPAQILFEPYLERSTSYRNLFA